MPTPTIPELIRKIEAFVGNLQYHIDKNDPTPEQAHICKVRINDYTAVLSELRSLPEPLQRNIAGNVVHGRGGSFCQCRNDDKTGQTGIYCCNICGLPDEPMWRPTHLPEPVESPSPVDAVEAVDPGKLLEWVAMMNDPHSKENNFTQKIILVDGVFYWENDHEGDNPLYGPDLVDLYKQSLTNTK